MRIPRLPARATVVVAVLASVVASTGATPASTLRPEHPARAPLRTVALYLMRGEKLGVAHERVPRSAAPAAAAMRLLLRGPSSAERRAGLQSQIPAGSRLLGVTLDRGVASVDLSRRFASGGGSATMFARLAQVVFTLTQFPTVHSVRLLLDGRPVTVFSSEGIVLSHPQTRANYESEAPAILVEWPAVGDAVKSPLHLAGSADVFEATFEVRVLAADGHTLAHATVHAACGTGCRGRFHALLPFAWSGAPHGSVLVFERSAKDGTPIHRVRIPVSFRH